MKRDVKMSQSAFDSASDLYQGKNLLGDQFLSYSLRLPKGWKKVSDEDLKGLQLSNKLPGVLAYYLGPSNMDRRSGFQVKAQKLDHMISARDWLIQYAIASKFTLQGLSAYGEDRAEGLYVYNEPDISYVVRVVVILNGPRVVIGEYLVPFDMFEKERDFQIWSTVSFFLDYLDKMPKEASKRFNFLDIGSFDYPASWDLQKGDLFSIDQMRVSIVNLQVQKIGVSSILNGRVDVYMFSGGEGYDQEKAFADLQNKLKEADHLVLGEEISELPPMVNDSGLKFLLTKRYAINDETHSYRDYQYWVTALKGENYYIFVCLVNPPRALGFYNWARNINAYSYVVKTVKEGL